MSKYIIPVSEEICSELVRRLKDHPLVEDTSEGSGLWYSNGETGPEWFTATIEADFNNKESVEELVPSELRKMGKSAGNMFWG